MKILLSLPTILLLCSHSVCFSQNKKIPTHSKTKLFHDPSVYVDFQFPKGDNLLITTQFWFYIKKHIYTELRYNYEDRKTFSFYMGGSFKIGKNEEFEVIPMVGGSVGRFKGISPATTMILEAGWIRGFSQNQYSINIKDQGSNFFFDWTAIVAHIYKALYLGVSLQTFVPKNTESQIYFAPMISVKKLPLIVEGFAYNFWTDLPMWALGIQYVF